MGVPEICFGVFVLIGVLYGMLYCYLAFDPSWRYVSHEKYDYGYAVTVEVRPRFFLWLFGLKGTIATFYGKHAQGLWVSTDYKYAISECSCHKFAKWAGCT